MQIRTKMVNFLRMNLEKHLSILSETDVQDEKILKTNLQILDCSLGTNTLQMIEAFFITVFGIITAYLYLKHAPMHEIRGAIYHEKHIAKK